MKMRKTIGFLIMVVLLLLLAMQSKWYWFRKQLPIDKRQRNELVKLAILALQTEEVPVASLVIYNGEIIGRGYNTVLRDTSISGHAEINAISDAIKHLGFVRFNQLNRDSLKVISTFEPCMMCRGAIIENRIKYLEFIREKELIHWLKNHLKSLKYETNKQKLNANYLQDSLFMLHPNYHPD